MPKNKRPQPRKPSNSGADQDTALAQTLCELALELAEQEDGAALAAALRQQQLDFDRLIRKALNQKKDEVLYEAIARAGDADVDAYLFLRSHVEEAASTFLLRREGAPTMEINAFVIPLFAHSTGGLRAEQDFQDPQAFELLVQSFQQAGLESPDARVVLVRHAYDLGEIDRISYSDLHAMVREALATLTEKKIAASPALERSMAGWSGHAFGAQDSAVELRFLLGFALKRADDPFYQAPDGEAAADAYFSARMARYRDWTGPAAALVKRCLAGAETPLALNFLYQDVFHGGKEQGLAEYFMLQMMTEVNHALRAHQLGAGQVAATIAPADAGGDMVLRVQLSRAADGAALAAADKPLDLGADLEAEVDDLADALATIGVDALSVALRFDRNGLAIEPRPYRPR